MNVKSKLKMSNYYELLPNRIIDDIARERDILISGNLRNKQNYLQKYDDIYPIWINNLRNTIIDYNLLVDLTINQLYVIASIYYININDIIDKITEKNVLIEIIQILIPIIHHRKIPILQKNNPREFNTLKTSKIYNFKTAISIANVNRMVLNKNNIYICKLKGLYTYDINANINGILINIAKYPIIIDIILYIKLWTKDIKYLRWATKIITKNELYHQLMTKRQLIFLLSRGYITDFIPEQTLQRCRFLSHLSKDIYNIYMRLYKTRDILKVCKIRIKHPLEKYLELLHKSSLDIIIDELKIVVPPFIDKLTYIKDNIIEYRKIFKSQDIILDINNLETITFKNLSYLKDYDILSKLGVYVKYNSRNELLNKLCQLKTTKYFFIPLIRRCKNKETYALNNNTLDDKIFVIGYGTLNDYICYDLDDLLGVFEFTEIDGKKVFCPRRPDDLKIKFEMMELINLRSLLKLYQDQDNIPMLIDKLTKGIKSLEIHKNYELNIISKISEFPDIQQHLIRKFFFELFYTGMYMRKWKGFNYPFPYSKNETLINYKPFVNTLDGLNKLIQIEEQLSKDEHFFLLGYELETLRNERYMMYQQNLPDFMLQSPDSSEWVGGLKSIEWTDKTCNISEVSIGYCYKSVGEGTYCIRESSSIFIGTGYYYLNLLFNEKIPKFNPIQVQKIN